MKTIEDLANNQNSNTFADELQIVKQKFKPLRIKFCFIKKAKRLIWKPNTLKKDISQIWP